MFYAIDRFEHETAVLLRDDGQLYHVPRTALPSIAREGDCMRYKNGTWYIDAEETSRRNQEMHTRLHALFSRAKRT